MTLAVAEPVPFSFRNRKSLTVSVFVDIAPDESHVDSPVLAARRGKWRGRLTRAALPLLSLLVFFGLWQVALDLPVNLARGDVDADELRRSPEYTALRTEVGLAVKSAAA